MATLLPAPDSPDEPEGLALVNLETEAPDRLEHPVGRHERNPQLFDIQEVHRTNLLRTNADLWTG